jgi:hypothetical protein
MQESAKKRHIRRDLSKRTHCGIPVREGDVRLARFFRELEVLPRESERRAAFLGSMCQKCTRAHPSVGRD